MRAPLLAQPEHALSRAAAAPLGGRGPEEPVRGGPCTGAGLLLKHCFLCGRSACAELASGFLRQAVRGRELTATVSAALRPLSTLLSVCVLSTLDQLRTFNYNHLEDPCILLMNLKGT